MPKLRMRSFGIIALMLLIISALRPIQAAPLTTGILVSDTGSNNTIADPNSSRMIAIDPQGTIYVAYHGSMGVRVARSTDRGQSFAASVSISSFDSPVSIASDANGVIYVTYTEAGNLYFSRSTDRGLSFSVPTIIGSNASTSAHLATHAPYVYVLPRNGDTLYVNNNNGQGSFNARDPGLPILNFSDVVVDPADGTVYVVGDNPNLHYAKSNSNGASWQAPISPSGGVFFSAYVAGFGSIGRQLFAAGYTSSGYQIDLDSGTSSSRTFGSSSSFYTRSLAVDGHGNLIDGYSSGGNVHYALSTNAGVSFEPPITVATGATRIELAIHPITQDILALYEQNGQIYLNVYAGEIPATPTPTSTPTATPTATPTGAPTPQAYHGFLPVIQAGSYLPSQQVSVLFQIPAIATRPVRNQGEIFVDTPLILNIAALPMGGRFYLSNAPDSIQAITVDDQLAFVRADQDIFVVTFNTPTTTTSQIVEIPRDLMELIMSGDVSVEYRDVYGNSVGALEAWLIWVP
ncbi:MAG: hypothetical protein Fur005_36320 [Roseiflexaceae bacterium]